MKVFLKLVLNYIFHETNVMMQPICMSVAFEGLLPQKNKNKKNDE